MSVSSVKKSAKILQIAFALLAAPAAAQDKPCDVIASSNDWKIFHIAQKADTVKSQFCLSFTSEDARVKAIVVKVSDGTGLSIISTEGCLDMKGAETQTLTPLVITSDGDMTPLMPLGMEQAKQVYIGMSQGCLAEASHPKGTPVKWIGRLNVSPL